MEVLEKINFIQNKINFLGELFKKNQNQIDEVENRIDFTKEDIIELHNVDKLAKIISEKYSEKYINELKKFIDYTLQYIFHDESYQIKIKVKEKRKNNEIFFFLINGDLETSIDDIGSGVRGVTSLAIQIFVLTKFKKGKYLFLDEAFTEISEEYVDALFSYLREITEKLGFNILLITHDVRFFDYFDNIYVVENNTIKEVKRGEDN